ncbi:peptidyl-tRNA hydrolase Pth2 [Acidianus hospitalis]|jgi:PTH2 family peptidyl-tRNA hydrolase|uniref:Peptidyl-tRNA hydrolase n=2 Tax=Acidianus hospitalis TaxID=563177 RepID=A0A2T9X272_9CREN|nr:peptidyl-tRNA hydrolase Pth2 [Acidianus hospitalis]MDT7900996.1 peptidyl-tRNA hydrolase Pth2 [Acidianus sp.]PVU74203.1 aminoacyl-tRNA hydrolase [Acidianus hospitalis]
MKMVVMVRNDIKMGKGKIAAQVAHAAVSLVLDILNSNNNIWKSCLEEWINEGQPKIVVKVENLEELLKRAELARQKNLPVTIIQDAGKTQVEPGTITCAGIGPCEDSLIDSITGDLKLL